MKLDVAIVGASSAGLYAAERLAREGQRVAVFEQQPDLDPARRTLIVTPKLRHVLGDVSDAATLHRIGVMAVASHSAKVNIAFQQPDLIVERSELAGLLAGRAQEAGAELKYGHRFHGFEPHSKGAALRFSAGDRTSTVVARAVIGADGFYSRVAAAAGLEPPPAVPILQAEVRRRYFDLILT